MTLLLVALGGALGAALRYILVGGAARLLGAAFPWGVFAANILGSLAIGLVIGAWLERGGDQRLGLFLVTGVLGGFTTFSAFSLDAVLLLERGRFAAAAAYVFGSVAICLLAAWAGLRLARPGV